LVKQGNEKILEGQQNEANSLKSKLTNLMNNTALSWEDKLVEKMKELDNAMKQASDASINQQVQGNMVQIREKNRQIVELTRQKEEVESKMLQEVSDKELVDLQTVHRELISEYESIIKQKIGIFTDMIKNLN
jgi:threonine aldolase